MVRLKKNATSYSSATIVVYKHEGDTASEIGRPIYLIIVQRVTRGTLQRMKKKVGIPLWKPLPPRSTVASSGFSMLDYW